MSRGHFKYQFAVVLAVVLMAYSLAPLRADAAEQQLRAFPIRNSNSDDVANVLNQIFNDPDLMVASNARLNTIVVHTDAARMQQVQRILAQLDNAAPFKQHALVELARQNRRTRRLRFKPSMNIEVLNDGSVEIRAPTDAEYRVRGLGTRKGARVKKHEPLAVLDNSNAHTRELLEREVEQLREHQAESEALSRQHRGSRTRYDKEAFERAVKRTATIRAGIAEKSRQLHKLTALEGACVVLAEIDGIVTFAQTKEEYCPDDQPLEPNQLLFRITPE